MSMPDLAFKASVGLQDSKPVLRLSPTSVRAGADDTAYELSYDQNDFAIIPLVNVDDKSDGRQEGTLLLADSKSETLFLILRADSAILNLSVRPPGSAEGIDLVLNLAECMHGKPLSPTQFQQAQTELEHSIVVNLSPISCSYEDTLAEVMGVLRTAVILDRHTSSSRTSWLSGSILGRRILLVLDTLKMKDKDRVSLDVWSDMPGIADAVLGAIAKTSLGKVADNFDDIDVSWQLLAGTSEPSQLFVTVSEKAARNPHDSLFFTVDFQDVLSEDLEGGMPGGSQQLVIPIDITDVNSSWHGLLDEPFLKVFVSDAPWKQLEASREFLFTWREAVKQQIGTRLSSSRRFSDFAEMGGSLLLAEPTCSSVAQDIFAAFCLERVVQGCANQRLEDHCARAKLLSGLVICFEPERGLSGYLDMIVGPGNESNLGKLGTTRTWRDHISQIVNSVQEFAAKPVKLSMKKKDRRPGRPPMQLVPTMPLISLFHQFVAQPEKVVCAHCRFSPSYASNESTSVV